MFGLSVLDLNSYSIIREFFDYSCIQANSPKHKDHSDLYKDHNNYFLENIVSFFCLWWLNVVAIEN